ncbi:unnamed protein product [Didymodactylos carnosus]|uniref:Uncharacterized protein n=1 Tax=Didymodactylos carnosus TaxID=1234261 RepID=A0A8S2VZG0_9BILA|nr:unnamed protein product [Didymodactylos carnosus]CAF4409928.1 unnamed protein product [Didymodactylos carnosus]
MGHALDILLYLYDFCSNEDKERVEKCLAALRLTLLQSDEMKNTSNLNSNQYITSILSCYCILTYKNLNKLNEKEVSQILKLRMLIGNNSKLSKLLPSSLYMKMMITLFDLNSTIENVIDKNVRILNDYVENSKGAWKKDGNMNIYIKDCYSFIH